MAAMWSSRRVRPISSPVIRTASSTSFATTATPERRSGSASLTMAPGERAPGHSLGERRRPLRGVFVIARPISWLAIRTHDDVFVRDVQAGVTTRVSVGPGGVQADERSVEPSISGDGRFVAFTSRASNLIAGGGVGIYLHDRQTGVTSALVILPRGRTRSAPHDRRGSAATDATSASCGHLCRTSSFSSIVRR